MKYSKRKSTAVLPRIPLEGSLDLTYRCNNDCRHCWVRISPDSPEASRELTVDEIKNIVSSAREMGCRKWFFSGGEPLLRPDFPEIFEFVAPKAISLIINTNGTPITPSLARLFKEHGTLLVAVYGATAEIHDHITRNPGSFDAALRGLSYLREAGVIYIIQIVPMKDNFHQFKDMIKLAESICSQWRIGASWLYFSADGDPQKNREIKEQRLKPSDVIRLDEPDVGYEEWMDKNVDHKFRHDDKTDCLFTPCILDRNEFHVDSYGGLSFCSFIKDPNLRYDLKKGSFSEGWEKFLPSLAYEIDGGKEYLEKCGSCAQRNECRWCPAFAFLEHRRYTASIKYLCSIAKENKLYKESWKKHHRRYYQTAGVTIQVDADLPITDKTFHSKFKDFEADGLGKDTVFIRHHFVDPSLRSQDYGKEMYRRYPWAIYKKGNAWIYLGISPGGEKDIVHQIAVFNQDHTRAKIYNLGNVNFKDGTLNSLTLFPTDQILLARILADREGCFFHSSAVVHKGKGFIFLGQSDAGKSTILKMFKDKTEWLTDDRNIVRRCPDGFKIHGSWSHGEIPHVSANSGPLFSIFFLEQSRKNNIERIDNKVFIVKKLAAVLVKPFVTPDWWEKMLDLLEKIADEVPCYSLYFNKSGKIVDLLERL